MQSIKFNACTAKRINNKHAAVKSLSRTSSKLCAARKLNNQDTSSSTFNLLIHKNSNEQALFNAQSTAQLHHILITAELSSSTSFNNEQQLTLEMMYNDTSIYASQQELTSTLNNNNQSSLLNSSTFLNNSTSTTTTTTPSSHGYFIDSISTLKLDQEIRRKLTGLRQAALELSLNTPAHVSMLQSLYELKMSAIRREACAQLRNFDAAAHSLEQVARSCNRPVRKRLGWLIEATGRLIKSGMVIGRRPKTKTTRSSSNAAISRNYDPELMTQQRERIEKAYENRLREMQCEIIKSIGDIEVQMSALRRRHVTPRSICCNHQHKTNHRRLRTPYQTDSEQRSRSSRHLNGSSSQKSGRSRSGTVARRSASANSSRISLNEDSISSQFDLRKYKNPYAHETAV